MEFKRDAKKCCCVALKKKRVDPASRPRVLQLAALKYQRNRETIKAKIYAYRKANPERLKEINRKSYLKNRVKVRARQIEYKPRAAANEARRRAIKRRAPIGDQNAIADWMTAMRQMAFAVCFWCNRKVSKNQRQADHIQPLAKGGKHALENLCVSCRSCNQAKHDKPLHQWNARLKQPVLL